jgi:hypothetical protein
MLINTTALIFSEKTSARLNYVCKLIFNGHLGINFNITNNIDEFTEYPGAKLIYRQASNGIDIHISPHGLLFETSIEKKQINTCNFNGLKVPFATNGESFPFDIFSAIFYLVSRYEEYLPYEKNKYGQFKATNSLLYKLGILDKPVVDIWILKLKEKLSTRFPKLLFKEKKFTTTFTYDIDVAYAYRGRLAVVTIANLLRDFFSFQFKKIIDRYRAIYNGRKDPFDTYAHILKQKKDYGHNLLFFFLLGPKNKFNHNLPPSKRIMQQLISNIAAIEDTGIHPSYYTDANFNQLLSEKNTLEFLCHKKITKSRQHYLRLLFPKTYCNLIKAGVKNDYTLSFAELPGFRAGTCTKFNFYNLSIEQETELILNPNTFMEGTFIEDMRLSPSVALPLMKQLVDEVKKVNGHFISIWHNHTLSDNNEWKGLKAVHDTIAKYASSII